MPFTASAAMAKRWNGEADGCSGRCGGTRDGRSRTRSSASASRAASAVSMCPTWTGSSVPPRIPRRAPKLIQRRSFRVVIVRGSVACSCGAAAARSRAVATSRHTASSRRVEPLAGRRRHSVERNAALAQMLLQPREPLGLVERVDLVRRDDQRLVGEPLARRRRGPGTASSSRVMTSKSSTGSRPVIEDTSTRWTSTLVRSRWLRKRWPRPCPACAPSISPGTSATTNDRSPDRPTTPEVRHQRGERVVGDLRPRGRDARDQRRLAGVREADQADVGQQLQVEAEVLLFAGQPGLRPCAARGWSRWRTARCPSRRARPWR